MNTANIKLIQDTYTKIDEYKAKFRIPSRAYGWHFSGGQTQGWTRGQYGEVNIAGTAMELRSGETVYSPQLLMSYYKCNECGVELEMVQQKDNGLIYCPHCETVIDSKRTNINFSQYKYLTLKFSVTNTLHNGNIKIFGISDGYIEIKIVPNQYDYLAQISIENLNIKQIIIEADGQDAYIDYIKLDVDPIIEIEGIINIYDDDAIYKFLNNQKASNKFVTDTITSQHNEITNKPTDNYCATCDQNTCGCYEQRYGYQACSTDGCILFTPCTCNSSCHLQERTYCHCDQLFYDKDAPMEKSRLSPIGKNLDILKNIKPTLTNLTIVDDSLKKYMEEQTLYNNVLTEEEKKDFKFTTVKFKKIDKNKPAYIDYNYDVAYKLNPDSGAYKLEAKDENSFTIRYMNEASNSYDDLRNQAYSEVSDIATSSWLNQTQPFTKIISSHGETYLIFCFVGPTTNDYDSMDYNNCNTYVTLYHKLYKVVIDSNRYKLEEINSNESKLYTYKPTWKTGPFDSLIRVANNCKVKINQVSENSIEYILVFSADWGARYRMRGGGYDTKRYYRAWHIKINHPNDVIECLVSANYDANDGSYGNINWLDDNLSSKEDSGISLPLGLMPLHRRNGESIRSFNTRIAECKKHHLNYFYKDSWAWGYYNRYLQDHLSPMQLANDRTGYYNACSIPEIDINHYVSVGPYMFGTTITQNKASSRASSNGGNTPKYYGNSPYTYGSVHVMIPYSDYNYYSWQRRCFNGAGWSLYAWIISFIPEAKILSYLISPSMLIRGAADMNATYGYTYDTKTYTGLPGYEYNGRQYGTRASFSTIRDSYVTNSLGTSDREFYINERRIIRFYSYANNDGETYTLYISVDNHLFSYKFIPGRENSSGTVEGTILSNEVENMTLKDGQQIIYIGNTYINDTNDVMIIYKDNDVAYLTFLNDKNTVITLGSKINEGLTEAYVDGYGNFISNQGNIKIIETTSDLIDTNSYDKFRIEILDDEVEFTDYKFEGSSIINNGDLIPCTCDQKWYGATTCSCNSTCDSYTSSCACYMTRY